MDTPHDDARENRCLEFLATAPEPVSGRRVATALGVSPTTAGTVLGALLRRGLVVRQPSGRATLWSLAPTPTRRPTAAEAGVVVLTALPLEHEAVRAVLYDPSLFVAPNGSRFVTGTVPGRGVDWRVHLAELGMGNARAAAETASAAAHISPRLVAFVGIAGGLKPSDQARGDVVVADRAYALHSGKLTNESFASRPLSFTTDHRTGQLVREVARNWRPAAIPGTRGRAPRAELRPIVAGEVVLAGDDTELRRLIAERYNDAAAIDMESFGMYEAAHLSGVPALAIRGISDLIGDKQPSADKVWQPRAAATAAAFLAALLAAASPDDFGTATPPRPGPQAPAADPAALLDALPPQVRPWARRLADNGSPALHDALADLSGLGSRRGGWLGRLRHRPPAWLRADTTGDAWALVGAYAAAHRSPVSAFAFSQAATAAAGAGLDVIAAIHATSAALAAVRYQPSARPGQAAQSDAARAQALADLDAHDLAPAAPVAAVVRAAIAEDPDTVGPAAAAALGALGLPQEWARAGTAARDAFAAACLDELADTDPDVHAHVQAEVLGLLASIHVVNGEDDAALAALRHARALAPHLAGIALTEARVRLQQVSTGLPPVPDLSARLEQIERDALLVRSSMRRWDGPTADALDLAARARTLSGDARGALRMLLPRPDGDADDAEAHDPALAGTVAACALAAGDARLSLRYAAAVKDPVERELARAAAMTRLPGMSHEAQEAFRTALTQTPDDRPQHMVRALLGLVYLGVPLRNDPPTGLADELRRLRAADPASADLLEASAALDRGHHDEALALARRHPGSVPASHIAAEALVGEGRAPDAVRVLERASQETGDESLLAHALSIAGSSGQDADARRIAAALTAARSPAVRRDALQALVRLAEKETDWHEVASRCQQLLDLSSDAAPSNVASARWQLAAAQYNLRRFDLSRRALDEPDLLAPRNASEALLLLAVMGAAPGPDRDADVRRALDAAERWPDDERVGASALSYVVTAGASTGDDTLLARAREQQETFFATFPDTSLLKRIDVGEDLSGLAEYLRETLAPSTADLADLARRVWLGDYPLAVLADSTGRSYAELLVRRDLGCVVVSAGNEGIAGRAAAERALASGAVADLSALALARDMTASPGNLIADVPRVVLPAAARDDVLAAAQSLSLRSVGSMGWDAAAQRPVFSEHPRAQVDAWAVRAEALAGLMRHVDVIPPVGRETGHWDASLAAAASLGLSLWADDAALRAVARAEGVDAFATLDLLAALEERGRAPAGAALDAADALIRVRAVDLDVHDRLLEFAAADGWRPDGYAGLLLSRPAGWRPADAGAAQFRDLVRALPPDGDDSALAGWFAAAATGLAWSSPPVARARVVGALLAWTSLDAGRASALPALVAAAVSVLDNSAPGADLAEPFVTAVTSSLHAILDPTDLAVAFTRLIAELEPQTRLEMMAAFLGRTDERQ